MKAALPFAIAAAATLAAAPAQQPQQPFRTATDLVPVFATVRDRDARLVTTLKQEDFTITDNGKVQPIAFFSNEVEPLSVVVMLDRSGSMFAHQFEIRDAASAFIQQLKPDDRARIGSFGDYVGNRIVIKPSEFSSNKGELLDILRAPVGVGRGSPVFISIDQSIAALANREGRRVIIIFSDGYDDAAPSLMAVKFKDLIDRARQADVMVCALGFIDVQQRSDGKPKITPPDPSLRQLAEETGGAYLELQDAADLTDRFTRIAEELHRQYRLAFAPPLRDGKVHTILVRVADKDLAVRARQSYVAPK